MKSYFVFDCESVGLHGETFACGGGVYLESGEMQSEFSFACLPDNANGTQVDRKWISECVPALDTTHATPREIRDAFWKQWLKADKQGAKMAADCGWPVKAKFLLQCVADDPEKRNRQGPYPMIEIATLRMAAGMDPVGECIRKTNELPEHDPLADVRQSARLLFEALAKINEPRQPAGE